MYTGWVTWRSATLDLNATWKGRLVQAPQLRQTPSTSQVLVLEDPAQEAGLVGNEPVLQILQKLWAPFQGGCEMRSYDRTYDEIALRVEVRGGELDIVRDVRPMQHRNLPTCGSRADVGRGSNFRDCGWRLSWADVDHV